MTEAHANMNVPKGFALAREVYKGYVHTHAASTIAWPLTVRSEICEISSCQVTKR